MSSYAKCATDQCPRAVILRDIIPFLKFIGTDTPGVASSLSDLTFESISDHQLLERLQDNEVQTFEDSFFEAESHASSLRVVSQETIPINRIGHEENLLLSEDEIEDPGT